MKIKWFKKSKTAKLKQLAHYLESNTSDSSPVWNQVKVEYDQLYKELVYEMGKPWVYKNKFTIGFVFLAVLLTLTFIHLNSTKTMFLVAVCQKNETSCQPIANAIVDLGYHVDKTHCIGRANFLSPELTGKRRARCYECIQPRNNNWFFECKSYQPVE